MYLRFYFAWGFLDSRSKITSSIKLRWETIFSKCETDLFLNEL